MAFADVPGGFLYYQTRGHGRDVVLLNAGAADLRMWDSTLDWLTDCARVTVFDCRDSGLSSVADGPYSEVDDVIAVLDAAGVQSAVLVGVSDGARRALAVAHTHPGRVDHVVAVAGSFGEFPDPSEEEATARVTMRAHFAEVQRARTEEGLYARATVDIDAWAPALSADDRRKMIALQFANSYWVDLEEYHGSELDPPIKTRFRELTTPISVLVGGRDFAGTQLWARRLADQAPRASLTVVPEADHFPMFSAPHEFERVVREALK